jgi:LacI family sucrose operon transcriptional repressor
MAKKVTFSDIAKYTGFSKTTISRYFNNPDSLTVKNQEIIKDALKKLNYQENKLAKVLANGKSEFVGIIIPNLYLHYYGDILNQLLTSYETYGYKFLVFVGTDHPEVERSYIKELLAYEIEGMIVLSHTLPSEELASFGIPVVTIEREDRATNSVNCDNYMGGVQAASLLGKCGCDILIHINDNDNPEIPAYGRIRGFTDACLENHLNSRLIIRDLGNTFEANQTALTDILDQIIQEYPGKKKGLFLSNDTLANIMLNVIVRRYGKLPDDFCLVGFDNSPVSREAIIPFSTVGQQIDQIAAAAMDLLVSRMDERKKRRPKEFPAPVHKQITPILIRRETTPL